MSAFGTAGKHKLKPQKVKYTSHSSFPEQCVVGPRLSSLLVMESIVCKARLCVDTVWPISSKSAVFQFGYLDRYTDHLRGGTTFSLRDGCDGRVATPARNSPEEYALPWQKVLINGDPSSTSWQANRQIASVVLNLSNYWPTFYLSSSTVWVFRLQGAPHQWLSLIHVRTHAFTYLIYWA